MVFEPGTYKHTCPACGNVIVFTVGAIYSLHERPATERGGSWMANLVQDAMLRQ
jgi:hypothetical protein